MANFDTSFDVASDGNSDISDFVGFTEEDLVDNISIVQDSEPNYSDIEVSSVESMDILDFGESGDETMNSDVDEPQEIVFGQIISGMLHWIHLKKKQWSQITCKF